MRKHIEKIKKKPKHEIKKISIILAAVTTVIIVAIWIVILSIAKKDRINKDEGVFDALINDVDNMNSDFINIKNKMSNIKIIGSVDVKK